MQACAHSAQVAGCARSSATMASTGPDRDGRPRGPTGEWIRGAGARAGAGEACQRLEDTVSSQIRQLRETGHLHRREKITATIDMHLIPRYDKKYGAELVRAKRKNGTHVFERYITIHCVDDGRRLALGMAHMPALEDTANFVRKIIESAVRASTRIDTVMMDREFFSADVMAAIDALGIWYLVPCKNTDTEVCALGEFAASKHDRVSESVIVGDGGKEVPYTMLIACRKKKRKRIRRRRTGSARKVYRVCNQPARNGSGLVREQVGYRDCLPHDRGCADQDAQQESRGALAVLCVLGDSLQHMGCGKRDPWVHHRDPRRKKIPDLPAALQEHDAFILSL